MKLAQKLLLLSLLLVLIGTAFSAGMSPRKKSQPVRVLLTSKKSEIELKVKSGFTILTQNKKILQRKRRGAHLNFKIKNRQLVLGEKELRVKRVRVIPRKDGALQFGQNQYRGEAHLFIGSKGKLTLVNVVDLEDYLKSVVPGEVAAKWPKEALKAQAVAARSYAAYHMKKNKLRSSDIQSPLAQNYRGIKKEHSKTSKAVDATRGQVLTFRGYLFPTFFHSTCGGLTELPQNVWTLDFKIPENRRCKYCKDSPHYQWNLSLTKSEIEKKFKEAGKPLWGLKKIVPSRMSKSKKHITEITCVTASGKKRFRINEFRRIIGFNIIKSSRFKTKNKRDQIVFSGSGWGHGVGMCQWGARGMAKKRKKYKKILSHYYPKAKVKKVKL